MSRWKGRASSPAFKEMLRAIEALGAGPSAEPVKPVQALALPRSRLGFVLAIFAAASLITGLVMWRPWSNKSPAPVVAVAAGSQSAQARSLARDLLTKLGQLHATQTDALKLVQGDDAGRKPDLIFEVDGATQS